MKTFKTIEDYEKYMRDFVDTIESNKKFLHKNGVTIVFSTSVISPEIGKQIVCGRESEIVANLCGLILKLRKDLFEIMIRVLKKVK